MRVIRLLHPNKYNKKQGKFTRAAFRNSKDDGCLSVVGAECIDAGGRSICAHIREFYQYPGVVGEPPVFWEFESDLLPAPHRLEPISIKEGDCHLNVAGVSDEALWEAFEKTTVSDYSICDNGAFHPTTAEQIISLQTN